MFNFSVTNVCVATSEIFKMLESALNVIRRSSLTMTAAVLMFSSVIAITGVLGPPSFEIVSPL